MKRLATKTQEWAFVLIAISVICICGCKTPPESPGPTFEAFKPTFFEVGTILEDRKESPALVQIIKPLPGLVQEYRGGAVDESDSNHAKISAAAEIFQRLGLSAEIQAQKYRKATISASEITKRTLNWDILATAFKERKIDAKYFSNTNLVIVNSDTKVSGLVIEIAKSDLSKISVGILMQNETLKTGVSAEMGGSNYFKLKCKQDVITDSKVRRMTEILRQIGIDPNKLTNITPKPLFKHVKLTLRAYGHKSPESYATIRWGHPVYNQNEYFHKLEVKYGTEATQDFYVSESDTEFEMQTEKDSAVGYSLRIEVDDEEAIICKFNVGGSSEFTNKGVVNTVQSAALNGTGEFRLKVFFNEKPNPGRIPMKRK